MKRKVLLIPLIIFLAIAAALLWQLARNAEGDDPTNLESALIGKPAINCPAFMVLVIGGSLLLFAARGHKVRSRVNNALWSRESLLLANNVLLVAAMLVVLLGTLLPLVHKQLGLGSISIGEPFFNTMFTWLMVPFALLLGVGPLVRWGRDRPRKIRNLLIIAFISTLVLSLLLPWLFESKVVAMTVLGLAMACWIAVLAIAEAALRISRGTKTTFSYWGMVAAHLGLAVTIVGIAFSQNYSVERDVRMKSGDSVDIHEYRFTFRDVKEVTGPNWRGGVNSNLLSTAPPLWCW